MSAMNEDLLKWFILTFLVVYGVSELSCPKVAELGSSVQLLCTYSNPSIVSYTSSGISGTIATCDSNKCINVTEGYYPTFISVNKSKLEIRKVQLKDGGDWICQAVSTKLPCTLVLTQTPTCHITSGNDTNNLDIHENISLSVNITDYYCSTPIDFLLRAGNTEEVLIKQTTVEEKNITSDVFDSTFNITEAHIGVLGLVFICNGIRRSVTCSGVHTLLKRQTVSTTVPSDGSSQDTPNIIAIIVGTIAAVIFVVIIVIFFRRTSRKRRQLNTEKLTPKGLKT